MTEKSSWWKYRKTKAWKFHCFQAVFFLLLAGANYFLAGTGLNPGLYYAMAFMFLVTSILAGSRMIQHWRSNETI